jgi:hypothetical protein
MVADGCLNQFYLNGEYIGFKKEFNKHTVLAVKSDACIAP